MKIAIVGGGQLGMQLYKGSPDCQHLIIGTRPTCRPGFEEAELGYSNKLEAAVGCDIVAVALPPSACQAVYEELCPLLPAGTIVMNFPTKWNMPQELKDAYPQLKLMESKLLGSAVGLSLHLNGMFVLSDSDEETVSKIKAAFSGLRMEVGAWDKVPYLNKVASKTALGAAVDLELALSAEGFGENEIKTLLGGLFPGIIYSYSRDTLGEFALEIVKELKKAKSGQ